MIGEQGLRAVQVLGVILLHLHACHAGRGLHVLLMLVIRRFGVSCRDFPRHLLRTTYRISPDVGALFEKTSTYSVLSTDLA